MGELPARYHRYWGTEFWSIVDDALRPGVTILDVGSGRRPTISPEVRPEGSQYVGIDVSAHELEVAELGSYDQTIVADAQSLAPELVGRFDLIVSWQVLEHFSDMRGAAQAFHQYAKEEGLFVACLSGRHAVFAIANRVLPRTAGRRLVARLMRRPIDTVFDAYYDHCDDKGLRAAFSDWDEVRVIPLWRGADYFERFPRLRSLYVRYEDLAIRRGWKNLATHYVIAAGKGTGAG